MDEAVVGTQEQNIAPVTPSMPQDASEKVLRQSEVNELVGRIKHEAYTKGLREGMTQAPQSQGGGQLGGQPQITDDHVRQLIADEAQKQSQVAAAHQLLSNFVEQMGAGKGKYSDFDETVANLGDLKNIPHVVELASGTGIAGDVMYELGRNPGKVASLTTLAYINPDLAKLEMRKLADSIKTNEQASQTPNIDEPYSQIKPSNAGKDNGSLSVRDLRRKSWARS